MADVQHKEHDVIEILTHKVEEFSLTMERLRIAEYVELLNSPRRLMYVNFISGFARGLGAAVGWLAMATILVWLLRNLVAANLPYIGGFIAELVRLVEGQLAR